MNEAPSYASLARTRARARTQRSRAIMLVEGDWETDGFVIARGAYDAATVSALKVVTERCLAQWSTTQDPASVRGSTSFAHLNHPRYHEPRSVGFAALMEAIADPAVLQLVEELLQSPAVFRSTQFFFNPTPEHGGDLGQEGNWHRDCKFLIPDETEERDFLAKHISEGHTHRRGIAMQMALVSTDDLELVAGSHARYDTVEEYAVRLADGGTHSTDHILGATKIVLQPGDAVLFNSYGFHRGRYRTNVPRRTVLWSFSSERFATYDTFSDQPWLLAPGYLDGLSHGCRRFFERYISVFRERIAARGVDGAYVPYAEQVAAQMAAANAAARL
jgi:ectoine hydroxylase-related dioxygenase (phytanoyl-CoA dioxygenase family)